MKKFYRKLILFLIPICLILLIGLLLPLTPRVKDSLLFAGKDKDSLLIYTPSPRIIFVGGSNLSFGLNSAEIKDSLYLNPINTAVHAEIGLKFMIYNTLQYIKKGDIVVVAPEYIHFYKSYEAVSFELFLTALYVSPNTLKSLSFQQYFEMLKYIPKLAFSKFKPWEYKGWTKDKLYGVSSFNKFGDAVGHWELKSPSYEPQTIVGQFNEEVIVKLKEFETNCLNKGAVVYVTFPGYDELSFRNSKDKVLLVEQKLKEYKFKLLGSAKRYVMPEKMMYDNQNHLSKEGVEYRTKLLIEDYRNYTFLKMKSEK